MYGIVRTMDCGFIDDYPDDLDGQIDWKTYLEETEDEDGDGCCQGENS